MDDVRLIAFYLPQFHPIDENDEWWGKGFTEWTNVSSAKPLFPGHHQPHIPADLGFYDLRLAEAREAQARMAQNYGVYGFCYYYYYFNGKRLLNRPLDDVLSSGKPDFPFCICWANENWTRNWDGRNDEILIEQVHSQDSDLEFIRQLVPVLNDKRYIRVNNKLLVLVYRTDLMPEPQKTSEIWRNFIREEVGEELYLCTVDNFIKDFDPTTIGFDGAVQFPLSASGVCFVGTRLFASMNQVDDEDIKNNHFVNYPSAVNQYVSVAKPNYPFFRGVFPSWDNTPRRQNASAVFINSTPEFYKLYLRTIIGLTRAEHSGDERLIFINAWNEWAEGAHLEPDKKYGLRFLEATKEALVEGGDYKLLMEEIKVKDAESKKVFSAAGQLIGNIAMAEEKIRNLDQLIETQKTQFADQLSTLTRRIEEKDLQILQFGNILGQKDLLVQDRDNQIQEKHNQIQEKHDQIRERDNLIQEKFNLIQEKQKEIQEKYAQILERDRQILENENRILDMDNQIRVKNAEIFERETRIQEKDNIIREKVKQIQLGEMLILERESQIKADENLILEKENQIKDREDRIRERDEHIRERDNHIRERDNQILERDEYIREKDNQIRERDNHIQGRDNQIRDIELQVQEKELQLNEQINQNLILGDQIRELESRVIQNDLQIKEMIARLEQLTNELDARDHIIQARDISLTEKDEMNRMKDRLILEKEAVILGMENSIKEKDALNFTTSQKLLNALHKINVNERIIENRDRSLNSMYNSYSWKITKPLRWSHALVLKISHGLFPDKSNHGKLVMHSTPPARKDKTDDIIPEKTPVKEPVVVKKENQKPNKENSAIAIISKSKLFDPKWYLENHPDIKKAGADPLNHFANHGFREGRMPNPLFDTKWYVSKHPEVADAGINPLIHYINNCTVEGHDPNPVFSSKWYLDQNRDVAKAGINPLAHYLNFGAPEKRNILKPDIPAKLTLKNIQSVAVVCHVYYPELWEELSISIRNIPISYELYISLPEKNAEEIRKKILLDFPQAHIKIVKNVGGDVYPFMIFLEEISLAGHTIFCKIHTKRGITNYGDLWRNVLLSGVLGSEPIVINILNAFDSDPDLAIAGSELLYKSAKFHEYNNRAILEQLYAILYPGEELPDDWGFFAGTMFWGRTKTFLPLARVIHEHFKFEQERLNIDGQLAHAVERMVGAIAMREGAKIGLVGNELAITRSRYLQVVAAPGIPSLETPERSLLRINEMYSRAYASPGTSEQVKEQALPGGSKKDPNGQTVMLCAHAAGCYLAGGEVSFLDMAHGLKNNGFNIIVILPKYNKEYVNALSSIVHKFYYVPYKFWGVSDENKTLVQKLIKIIELEKISLVYVNTIMIREPLKAAKIKGIPGLIHVRELISGDEVLAGEINKSIDEIKQKVLKRSDFIIANSQATAKFFQKSDATFIIPNTIDVRNFDIKNRIDIKNITVALISSNVPKKGIYEFIEVARICEKKLQYVRFLFIGEENDYMKDLMARRKENGVPDNVYYAGYSTSPVDAVSKANIVVNLSLFSESFGRTVLEAMAARRPVVAYDFGAISELIEEGGNGYLVPFKDVAAVAEKIEELCNNPHKIISMGEHGREIAIRRYSKDIYDQTMGKVLNDILTQWPLRNKPKKERVNVSVVIPNYNYSGFLQERISSIINQSVSPAEIIFLDDASADDSVAVAREILSKTMIPFKIIVNPINQGTYRQWLKGIAEATGEYIWIAEADDSCSELFLEKLFNRIVSKNAVMVYSQSQRMDESDSILAPHNLHHTDDLSRERWKHDFTEIGLREVVDYLVYRNSIPNVSACLFNKSFLSDIPEEFTSYQFIGDWFLYCHLLSKGFISYISEPLNKFRRHSGSITRIKSKSDAYLRELIKIKKFIVCKFPIHASQIEKMAGFLNQDFKINGLEKNTDHESAANFFREIKVQTEERKRLVFLTTNIGSYYGGSEQLWIETAIQTRRQNHDVMVVIKKWDPAPAFFQEFHDLGIKILFKEEIDFTEVVVFNPDLMVISIGDQDEGTEWYDQCQKNHIPYIIINQLTKEPKYWPIRKDITPLVKNGYLRAEKVFFTCHNNHRVMEKRLDCKIPNARIHFNPFHFDRDSFVAFPSMENGLRIAIPANLLRIHKGQHLAIEIFNSKKWKDRSVELHLYGKGRDEEILKEMAAQFNLKNVFFHQRTPDLLTIWRDNHAIFLPSFMEGLPIVLVGAMICARVPILTDIGGHCEVVEDNINGFIAKVPTIESLDDALERAYQRSSEWEQIGKKSRERILSYLPSNDPVDDFITKIMPLSTKKSIEE